MLPYKYVDFPSILSEYRDSIKTFGEINVLLEFGLKNFFCFKEGISISFKLDSNCPSNISQGRNFTTILGIKGANGSGKTHALKGLAFLSDFCTDSFSNKPEDLITIDSFYDNAQPSELYAEFSINDITYLYESALPKLK